MYLVKNYIKKLNMIIPGHLVANSDPVVVSIYTALYMMADTNDIEWMRRKTSVYELCTNATFFNTSSIRKRHFQQVYDSLRYLEENGYIRIFGDIHKTTDTFTYSFVPDLMSICKEHAVNGKNLNASIGVTEYKIVWHRIYDCDSSAVTKAKLLRVYIALRIYGSIWGFYHKNVDVPIFVGNYTQVTKFLGISSTTMTECIKELRSLDILCTTYAIHEFTDGLHKSEIASVIVVFKLVCGDKTPDELTDIVKMMLCGSGEHVSWYPTGMTLASAKSHKKHHSEKDLDVIPEDIKDEDGEPNIDIAINDKSCDCNNMCQNTIEPVKMDENVFYDDDGTEIEIW